MGGTPYKLEDGPYVVMVLDNSRLIVKNKQRGVARDVTDMFMCEPIDNRLLDRVMRQLKRGEIAINGELRSYLRSPSID